MELSFPEELLNTSVLVPIGGAPKSDMNDSQILPLKRPSLALDSPSSSSRRHPLPAPNTPKTHDPNLNSLLKEDSQDNSKHQTRLRTIQLELEKERELYTMHCNAATRCFERINNLMNEVSILVESKNLQPQLPSIFPTSPHSRSLDSISNINLTSNSSSRPNQPSKKLHESINDVSVTVKSKFFMRKPRCLMFPGNGADELADLMVTSSLDGSVQFSSIKNQSIQRSFFIPGVLKRNCFAEDMINASSLGGLILTTIDATSNNESDPGNSPSSILFLKYNVDKFEHGSSDYSIISSRNNPHQKAINVVEPHRENAPVSGYFRFFTGGLDKNIALWKVDDTLNVQSVQEIHRNHTSAVQAIAQNLYHPDGIWSGGADCRLLGWSLNDHRSLFSHRFNNRISYILTNDNHPSLLLTTFCNSNQQLHLLDSRNPLSNNPKAFGCRELSPTSRYLKPSWSLNGNLVAFGTVQPESKVSAVNVWDVRYLKNDSKPLRSIEFGAEKRFLSCEFWGGGNVIVALATDSSANFIEFTC